MLPARGRIPLHDYSAQRIPLLQIPIQVSGVAGVFLEERPQLRVPSVWDRLLKTYRNPKMDVDTAVARSHS